MRPSHTNGDTQIPEAVGSGSAPWTLVHRMRRGARVIVPGDGMSLWTVTHDSDLAKAFVGHMGNVHSIGHAFHITSDEALTWDQITQLTAAAADQGDGLIGDKARSAVFDTTKIKTFVPGFQATVPFSEGIGRTIAWFESHPEARTVDDAFNAVVDRTIAAYESGLKQAPR